MKSTKGRRRVFTDGQVGKILAWAVKHRDWVERKARHPTKVALARELGVVPSTIEALIARGEHYRAPKPEDRSRGRPPIVSSSETIARVWAWHRDRLALQALHADVRTLVDFAREMGAPASTVAWAIRLGGRYKQASPERLEAERALRARRLARLRELHFMW